MIKVEWQDLLDETKGEKPDAYVLYLRRSIKGKKGEEEKRTQIDNLSIDQQRDACLHVAKQRGLKVLEPYYAEEVSAKTPNKRPEFNKMLEFIRNSEMQLQLGILAWAPDRLSRNGLESGILIQDYVNKNILDFQFVTYHFSQDDSGIEYLMMEFARAMGYSLRLRKTVRRGMLKGYHDYKEWQFSNKFGYERLIKKLSNGTSKTVNFLIPHEEKNGQMGEFETVQLAFKLRLQGKTLDEIVKHILTVGFIDKRDKQGKISKTKLTGYEAAQKNGKSVIGILKDTFYYGLAKTKLGEVDLTTTTEMDDEGNSLNFIPAVTKEEFEICQTINDSKKKPIIQTHDNVPFRGTIICGHCQSTIQPQAKVSQEKVYYYCYNTECTGSKPHSQSHNKKKAHSGITGVALFEEIERILRDEFKLTERQFTGYLLHVEKKNQTNKKLHETDLKRIQAMKGHVIKQMDEEGQKLKNALSNLPMGQSQTAQTMVKQHENEMTQLKVRLAELGQKEQSLITTTHAWSQIFMEWLELMNNAYLYWKNGNWDQKKFIAENIFLELTVKDGKIASYKYIEAPEALKNANLSLPGGRGGT